MESGSGGIVMGPISEPQRSDPMKKDRLRALHYFPVIVSQKNLLNEKNKFGSITEKVLYLWTLNK